ncbi:MAG: bacillithiol biosynthesis deacetylase BshB1 [Bacteroidota bacterium]
METRIIYENAEVKTVDMLVIDAHPDDAEISAGGAIAKLTAAGKKVAIVDCTRGEMGTRGNPDLRLQESLEATKILKVSHRINLGMMDGFIDESPESLYRVISIIRRFKPKIILTHPPFERHPDHEAVHRLVRNALFKSGLTKIHTELNGEEQEIYRTRKIFCFMQSYQFERKPDFYIDISDFQEIKMRAIEAFASQVYVTGNENTNEPQTKLSSPEFKEELVARAKYFGSLIGVRYAEAYLSVEPVGISCLSNMI